MELKRQSKILYQKLTGNILPVNKIFYIFVTQSIALISRTETLLI